MAKIKNIKSSPKNKKKEETKNNYRKKERVNALE